MQKIVVLLGGTSSEKEISLVTGEAIYETLKELKELSVEKYVLNEDIISFINFLHSNKNIIVFNALHGKFGEDGRIQSVLDLMKVPYTHSGVLTSALSMNKILTKEVAANINIPVAKHQKLLVKNIKVEDIKISYPFVLKPINEGSSVGIYLINNKEDLLKTLDKIQNFSQVMIEEYIQGVECTVGVLDGKALCVTEIIPVNTFYDYESKYSSGGSKHILPATIPSQVQETMKNYAQQIYKAFEARGAIRVDFIYNKDKNIAYMLEVNNQPGMTPTSLLPEQAKYLGMSFAELCSNLIKLAKYDD